MTTALKVEKAIVADIPFQDASLDIWDTKYRLKAKDGGVVDDSMDATYARVARALADVENDDVRDEWYEAFVWALQHGAIPAGRIISNAGAHEHKPATSTINCTVSGTINDSMHDILDKVHEAGLTLKAGCGIGYEFSTLRPKGAYVSGAGAYTSGPLSFMDIYDKMCFTVSSAGGRRGAQMGTFDVGHPDVMDFVKAKREDGRLRQFNLSLLVTDEFMQAVKHNREWTLAFPLDPREAEDLEINLEDPEKVVWREWPVHDDYIVNESGLVACRVYRTLPAQRLWDMIMTSTYDFAEPGFVLIDSVNEMNNNWFDENIRATNPCVTADTWVHTAAGPRQVSDLIGTPFTAVVDGREWNSGDEGFFLTATKDIVRLETTEGFELRLTEDHRVLRVERFDGANPVTGWCAAGDLRPGDRVMLHDHREQAAWEGDFSEEEGYLTGLYLASGGQTVAEDPAVAVRRETVAANGSYTPIPEATKAVMSTARNAARALTGPAEQPGWQEVSGQGEYRLRVPGLKRTASRLGLNAQADITPAIEQASSEFYAGFLRAWADSCAEVQADRVVLRAGDRVLASALQRMLLRLGVVARLASGESALVIRGRALVEFHQRVGVSNTDLAASLAELADQVELQDIGERYLAQVASVTAAGAEDVYDVQVPGINAFDANGIWAHNCGEQPLPPYGSCLLGSVNLTRFVVEPFTENAEFDWEQFRKVVKIFTRMLDNVVEINGLPLGGQRNEIMRKRRHGMGFLGLGSTLTMLRKKYGSRESVDFTEQVGRELAVAGWEAALDLSREKGPAPIMLEDFEVTAEMLRKRPEMAKDGYQAGDKVPGRILHGKYSRYMQRVAEVAPELVDELVAEGSRFTHHSSIAPTGTISLSLANNASNGIEPSFAHHYFRNVIREGRKSKEKVDVFSFELLAYRELVNHEAMPFSEEDGKQLPDYFITAEDITPREHVNIQAAAQKWVDSSISKTANVPTEFPYDEFKDIYMYAYEKGLKGCTTFRFNPEAFQGVLVKEKDLQNTKYTFTLEDGSEVTLAGDEEIEYDGETHTAANLFDALKEGYYGKF